MLLINFSYLSRRSKYPMEYINYVYYICGKKKKKKYYFPQKKEKYAIIVK